MLIGYARVSTHGISPSNDADDRSWIGGPIGQAVSSGSGPSATSCCPANWTAYGLFLVQCYSDPLFVGPARDIVGRTATLRGWRKATTAEAIAAGWHRTWDHRGRERWHCP